VISPRNSVTFYSFLGTPLHITCPPCLIALHLIYCAAKHITNFLSSKFSGVHTVDVYSPARPSFTPTQYNEWNHSDHDFSTPLTKRWDTYQTTRRHVTEYSRFLVLVVSFAWPFVTTYTKAKIEGTGTVSPWTLTFMYQILKILAYNIIN
jgi:hypothetical protein